MPKWIEFRELEPAAKTGRWEVVTKDAPRPHRLGIVGWFGRWREYGFFADPENVFEETCLRDIAEFCESQTKAHRKKRAEGVP